MTRVNTGLIPVLAPTPVPDQAHAQPVAAPQPRLAVNPGEASTASAHAKVILLGEHAVVHGSPAIVLPLHALRLNAEISTTEGPLQVESELYSGPLDSASARWAAPVTAITETLAALNLPTHGIRVRVSGYVPPERGLGSSAAVAAALSAAVAKHAGVQLSAEDHFQLIQAAERIAHGTPSGLDARGVVADGPLWFDNGQTKALPVNLSSCFVVADTGRWGGTRAAVAAVRAQREAEPERVNSILREIGAHTHTAATCLRTDDSKRLGELMVRTHALLGQLDVSSPELDDLVSAALSAGALGAKLTGGGRGGCVLALVDASQADKIAAKLKTAGAERTWIISAQDLTA